MLEIDWLAGNCPVQAEGTFDGEPFYFRARGSVVTLDVGDWEWRGPEYEWPDAGWIGEELARAFIQEAYAAWQRRNEPVHRSRERLRRRNGLSQVMMQDIYQAARIERALGEVARPVIDWLMEKAAETRARLEQGENAAGSGGAEEPSAQDQSG